MTTDRLLSTREACNILGIDRDTLYRYISSGQLKAYKLGTAPNVKWRRDRRPWRIYESDLNYFISQGGMNEKASSVA